MTTRLIGIDCATAEAKIGLALGWLRDSRVEITEVPERNGNETAADAIVRMLRAQPASRSLLAIDAPLGWPRGLSEALGDHVAGREIRLEANFMFRRATDRFVQTTLGKTPLDVGADRIARTAHAALKLLADVGRALGAEVPLAWSRDFAGIAAIEVYPAATLLARKLPAAGYKKAADTARRAAIIQSLASHLQLPADQHPMLASADALDAAVCVLAGADFCLRRVHEPTDPELARREGWIWFPSTTVDRARSEA
jgi:predicted RNase H-like nuclease